MNYIIAIDIGSTNTKMLIMKIENDNSEIIKLDIFDTLTYDKLEIKVDNILLDLNIDKSLIEIVLLTGSGSSYFDNTFLNINILKVDEFKCIAYGGLLLSNKDEGMVVNLGTGTTIVYSDFNNTVYLGGTGLGGGTLVGLAQRFNNKLSINEIYTRIENGNSHNVDLLISDISKNSISNLDMDITASNFAGIDKSANSDDIIAGFLRMITENIGLIIKHLKEKCDLKYNRNIPIVVMGTFSVNCIVRKYFEYIQDFTKVKYEYINERFAPYTTCIGLYEFYMLKERKVL